jgi:hypothetical protein
MAKPRLHLDADTSRISLMRALLDHGYDVTRTPNDWMLMDASDEQQLLGSTAQGRCIFTFNARDFIPLVNQYPLHGGIILSGQRPMPVLLKALLELLQQLEGEDFQGQVRWLKFN